MDDKEDAKTGYGYFPGYDDRVQLEFNYFSYANSNTELTKERDNSTNCLCINL